MKKIILIAGALLLIANCFSQTPNWEWAKKAGGIRADLGSSITTDASGNVYALGYFKSPTIVFGSTTLTNADNTGNTYDMYLVKYDQAGNVVWAKREGGNSNEYVYSVACDASGVYVTGAYESTSITFGTSTFTNTFRNSFIVKYDTNGTVLWADSPQGISFDGSFGFSVTTDGAGNVFAAGSFVSDSVIFGTNILLNLIGTHDIYIVKYSSSGSVLWARRAGGAGNDFPYSIAADATGSIYITGLYQFDPIGFDSDTLSNAGGYDYFIAKFDANGTYMWAKNAGGSLADNGSSITIDASGIYVTGSYQSSSITFGSFTLMNTGGSNLFLVKYDTLGNVLWAKTGVGEMSGSSLVAAPSGIYVAGAALGTIILGLDTLNLGITNDILIVKYDTAGTEQWVKTAGGSAIDAGASVAVDALSNIYVTGNYISTSLTFGSTTITCPGNFSDAFIAKLDNSCIAYYQTSYDSISNNFTLTVNPMTSFLAVAYLWDFGDGTTSTLATPSHIYTVDTVYNVCLKIYTANGDSCEYCHIIGKDYLGNIYRTVGFTINVQNNLTVNSPNVEQNETKIIIYPNPFTSQTTISFSEESRTNGTGNQHTIKIMNLLGECIQQLTTNNKQLILDMSDVAKGIYFVRIEDTSTGSATENKKVVNRKIIIQ